MRIVFVCTTNVWGSAMAELMARSCLSEWDPDHKLVQVTSAGVRAQIGAAVPAVAQHVLCEKGLDGSTHSARWMSAALLAEANLTLTMGEVQRNAVLAMNPLGLRSTFTIREAVGLLNSISVVSPLAPDSARHACAIVAEMAAARRFRAMPAGVDDLPDLMPDALTPVRALASQLEEGVRTVMQAILLPEFAIRAEAARTLAVRAPVSAVA